MITRAYGPPPPPAWNTGGISGGPDFVMVAPVMVGTTNKRPKQASNAKVFICRSIGR